MRACARACVGAHPDASASGCGAFALLGYGAPVATRLHLRWGAGAFALACVGIRCTVAVFVVVTVTDQPVTGGSHLKKKKCKVHAKFTQKFMQVSNKFLDKIHVRFTLLENKQDKSDFIMWTSI